jgi:recombination protein RecA
MSVAPRSVSTDNRRGMSGGTETQTTWAVREVPAGPLTRQGVPMAANSRPSVERAGDREKSLDAALLQIERQFGKGSIMRLGEETRVPVEVIPTGSIALDVALGLGGLPRGRIVEIYGPESSGKTTVALHAVANAQKAGGIAAFIDTEHALDPEYAKKLGVDTDAMLVSQPDTGEQALEIADMLIRSGALDIIVIDSVAALVPKAEIEGEMGDSHVGLQARLMSQALRKITGALNQAKTTAIFTNQLREKVGVLFGSPETTSGGKALKFYASVRLDVRRIETLKDGTDAVGNRTRVKVVKNKCLAEGTRIFDPVTGLTHRIEEIVAGRLPVHVVSADKNGELSAREVLSWFDQGEQEVIGLRLRDSTELWVTPDHKILTERGWRLAGELARGDRVARPRSFLGFGSAEPVRPDHARLLGYLIGDGYVGGKTPVHFINLAESLQQDAAKIAATLGCEAKPTATGDVALSHRPGEKNGVLELCRRAGIYGCLAPTKKVPPAFFAPGVSAEVVSNLVFGYFESDGYVSREQTGGIRVGFSTTSEQLAWQVHWLLLRWGIGSGVQRRDPRAQRGGLVEGRRISGRHPSWEVRVSGVENVSAFADAIPMWGPRGQVVTRELAALDGRYRGSQRIYLPGDIAAPVLRHLERRGVTPLLAARMIGETAGDPRGGMKVVLGSPRIRRDRLQRLADALDDPFLDQFLADQLWFSRIREILPARRVRTFDVEAADLHNLVAEDIVVHNCAPPFKVAEFDILYGVGISREGSLIDLGVEQGIVRKSGAWYTYEGDQLGQGKENARNFLRDNPDLANDMEKRIKEKLGVGPRLDDDASAGAGNDSIGANGRPQPGHGRPQPGHGRPVGNGVVPPPSRTAATVPGATV